MFAKELFYRHRETAPLTTGQNLHLFKPTLRVDIPAPTPKMYDTQEPAAKLAKQKRKRLFVVYENIDGNETGIFTHAKLDECQRFVNEYLQANPNAKLQVSTSPELTHPIK